ncbi:hypothetical protein D3C87_1507210 [compost metagenome]
MIVKTLFLFLTFFLKVQCFAQTMPPDLQPPECKVLGKYFVRQTPDLNSNGEFMAFYYLNGQDTSEAACAANNYGTPILKIEKAGSILLEIRDDLVFIDTGTGPGARGFEIYDLIRKQSVFKWSYNKYKFKSDNEIEFWTQEINTNACSKVEISKNKEDGFNSATIRRYLLNIKSMKLKKTQETKCTPVQ